MSKADAPIEPEALAPALKTLLLKAKAHGADAADAVATHGRSLSIAVREGALEDVDNSEGRDIGLRVMVGRRQACVSSSDLSNGSLDALAERAVAMAKLAPEDPYCGLAAEEHLELNNPDYDMFDPTVLTPEMLKTRALEIEKATLSVDGVAQAEGASASSASSAIYFMTSHGFSKGWRSSRHDLSGMAIASNEVDMERDADYQGARWLEDVRSPEDIGRTAGIRAVARLGSRQLPSGALPVIFERRVASNFISAFVGAITGTSIARGISFLKDDLGETLFSPGITICDNPHMMRGHGSRPWDGEGVSTQARNIVDQGKLTTWLLNSSTAKQLNLETTGHASRGIGSPPGVGSTNTYLAAGTMTPEDLMAMAGNGLWVSEMFGPSFNQNTGDYSVGVAGFEIINGERGSPVSEITVAGNLKEMFKTMVPANDLIFDGATVAPSIFIESLTLAGA